MFSRLQVRTMASSHRRHTPGTANDMHLDESMGRRPRHSSLRSELPSVLVAATAVMLIVLVNAGPLRRLEVDPVPVQGELRRAPAGEAVPRQAPPASGGATAGKDSGH
jgi:hypothetical protein